MGCFRKISRATSQLRTASSVNSAGHVTRYMPAEILNSAHERNVRYIGFFSVGRRTAMSLIHLASLGGPTF